MAPGSFTSDQGTHVNRIGGRFAWADLTACLDLGIESAPLDTSATITSTFASINMEVAQELNAAVSSRSPWI